MQPSFGVLSFYGPGGYLTVHYVHTWVDYKRGGGFDSPAPWVLATDKDFKDSYSVAGQRSLCLVYSLRFRGSGTSVQLTTMAANKPTSIGCRLCTPELAAITPVIAGKMAPPACAMTKIIAKASQQHIATSKSAEGNVPRPEGCSSAGSN